MSDAAEAGLLRTEFSKREWRLLEVLAAAGADGVVGVTSFVKETGLPVSEIRRLLNILERDAVVTRTVEQRPVKIWRLTKENTDES